MTSIRIPAPSRWVLAALLSAAVAAGCGGSGSGTSSAPPAIVLDSECTNCGMRIQDLGFASQRRSGGAWKSYDSIECLIADQAKTPGDQVRLPDHRSGTLAPAEAMWLVQGEIASPMGGGYAAFADRAAADSAAAAANGRVDRFAAFASPAPAD